MEQLKRRVGSAVRAARRQRKLTQEALAEMADVSTETISNVERGVTLPTIDVLFKLTRVLRLDLMRLAEAEPSQAESVSKERQRRGETLHEIAGALPDEKLTTLIEIARVLARG